MKENVSGHKTTWRSLSTFGPKSDATRCFTDPPAAGWACLSRENISASEGCRAGEKRKEDNGGGVSIGLWRITAMDQECGQLHPRRHVVPEEPREIQTDAATSVSL